MSRAADLQRHRQTAPDYWEITTKYPEDGDMVDWHDAADVIINLESKIAVSEKRYASLEQQIKRPDLREWMTDKNQRITELEAFLNDFYPEIIKEHKEILERDQSVANSPLE